MKLSLTIPTMKLRSRMWHLLFSYNIDVSTLYVEAVYCGSRSNINLSEFIWEYMCCFAVKTYSIVCVPLNTPTVLYLQDHRSNSDGWESLVLCNDCFKEILSILQPMVGNCTLDPSCRCNVCLRQPPSLRNLVSHTVFHYTFNLSEFILTDRTLYHQYLYAVESQTVSEEKLVPDTIYTLGSLKCWFVLDKRCGNSKRFHHDCVSPSDLHCYTTHVMYFEDAEEAIASLCDDIDVLWCNFCTRPLFKTRDCLFYGSTHI